MSQTQDFDVANAFIVEDITNPGQRVQWQAMFRTCRVISLQMLLSGNGPWCQMEPNFSTSHYLHMTDDFQKQHDHLAAIVRKRLQDKEKEMRWKLADFRHLEEKTNSATRQRFPMYCLALVTEAEKRDWYWKDYAGSI